MQINAVNIKSTKFRTKDDLIYRTTPLGQSCKINPSIYLFWGV